MESLAVMTNNDNLKNLKFDFNDNIELYYGLSYSVNRENHSPRVYNTKEETPVVLDFYDLFEKNYSDSAKRLVANMGEYENIAIAALSAKSTDYPILIDYLKKTNDTKRRVIEDILKKPGLDQIDFGHIKTFYGLNLSDEIVTYLSFFVSGGFGFMYDNKSTIVLGVKYNLEKNYYGVSGTLVCKLIHEFSHPYVGEIIHKNNLSLTRHEDTPPEYYLENYLEEALVRAMEIIFSSEIFGEEYKNWATKKQADADFMLTIKILDNYYANQESIKDISDFIRNLISAGIVKNY